MKCYKRALTPLIFLKKIIISTTTVAITLILFFSFQMKEHDVNQQSATEPALIPVKEKLFELSQDKNFQEKSKEQQIKQIQTVLEQIPPEYKKLKRQYQLAMSALPDIKFYGRVIDQYGRPISGAKVRYSGTSTYLSAGGGRGQVETDEQGYFEIDTEGAKLVLGSVIHPDIVYSHQLDSGLGQEIPQEILKSTKVFLSQEDNRGIYSNWRHHTEKEKIYIIHAWRLGKYEGAKAGDVIGDYDGDGKYYTLLLNKSRYKDRRKDGKTKGHIYISCTRPHMENNRDYGDWSISIAPVNGGIQEVDDLYMNQAPETGYQSSIDIDMRKGSSSYAPYLLNKRYYFKSNNGKEYGSLFIHIKPFSNVQKEACRLNIYYKINPTGSRNLELKRENTSQPNLPSSQKLALKGSEPFNC